ncbi:MAG: hypothetical protein Q9217_006969, partial [Psora testacea]
MIGDGRSEEGWKPQPKAPYDVVSSFGSRLWLRIEEGEVWPVRRGGLSSQLPTAAADVLYVALGYRTGGVVSQLHWTSGDGPRLASRRSEAHSVRHAECLGIADRWSVEGGRNVAWLLQWMARRSLDTYNPSFAASADFSRILYATASSVFCTLLRLLSKPAMAFVDLDSIHHFQPPRSTGRPLKGCSEGRSTAWKRGTPKVSSKHYDSVASVPKTKTIITLENWEPAGYIDLTTTLTTETNDDPFGGPAVSSRGTENVQDPPSIGPYLITTQEENDRPSQSVEKLLCDAREAQERQRIATNVDFESERADGVVEHVNPNNRDGSSTSRPKSDGDECEEVPDSGSVHPCGDGSVSDARDEQHGTICLPPTTASDSDARTANLCEKADSPTSGPTLTPSPISLPAPLPLPPPPSPHPQTAQHTNTEILSISENQAEPDGDALEEVGSSPSNNGKEKTDPNNGHNREAPNGSRTARVAGNGRASTKRPADIADLNEGGEGVPRSEKAQRLGESADQSADPLSNTATNNFSKGLSTRQTIPTRRRATLSSHGSERCLSLSSKYRPPGETSSNMKTQQVQVDTVTLAAVK